MIQIVPVNFDHVRAIRDREGIFFTGVNDDSHVRTILKSSIGFTMIDENGAPLASGGIIKQWAGVGTWWLLASRQFEKRGARQLLESARKILEMIQKYHMFHRFQVYVDPDQPRHIRFVEALGFTFEGKMLQHTVDRKDHLLYAKVF